MNYLSATDKEQKSSPYELIAVYVILSFLQGGGIGNFLYIINVFLI